MKKSSKILAILITILGIAAVVLNLIVLLR